jgi:hypothetical protein
VTITAGAPAGVFYGIQSLRQLLPPAIFENAPVDGIRWTLPAVTIEGLPRFSWRGAHLDVSRHFQPKEFVRKYIDLLALHKMNRFHWHLTDDQGWRVEIKRYPRLTWIAAWRKETILEAFTRGRIDRAAIDAAVARALRVKVELGLFEQPFVDVDQAAAVNGRADHLERARLAARKSIVLLRNEGDALPLAKTLRRVAVIGPDAVEARLGGYSRSGANKITILEGITMKLDAGVTVRHAPGPGREAARVFVPVPADALSTPADGRTVRGLLGKYFDNTRLEGEPRLERVDEQVDFRWTLNSPGRGIPFDWYSACQHATVVRQLRWPVGGAAADGQGVGRAERRSFGRRCCLTRCSRRRPTRS